MNRIKGFVRRSGLFVMAFSLFGAWVLTDVMILSPHADAAMVTSRKLALSSSANGSITTATPGDGGNGQKAKHTVTFTMATSAATIGSIALIYCDNPIPQTACTSSAASTGDASNLTSATVSGSGLGGSGWALDTATANPTITGYGTCNGGGTTRSNCVLLKPSSTGANTGTPTVTIDYGGGASNYVTNPTTDNNTFYVRIVVFSGTSYSGVIDNGAVANSTAQQIDITAKVQETLNFSVGSTVTAPGANGCTAFSDSGALTLGDSNGVLSFTQAYDAHSYFRVSTNANGGTGIYYSGDTLKNSTGTGTITSIGESAGGTSSDVGAAQFGLAIDSSDTQSGSGYSFTNLASITAPNTYAAGDGTITDGGTAKFQFNTGSVTTPVQIASASGPITCDTGSVRYLGNISTTIPPGIYTTTITYLAVPTY
jgi:hypothetical protein